VICFFYQPFAVHKLVNKSTCSANVSEVFHSVLGEGLQDDLDATLVLLEGILFPLFT